MFGWLLTRMLPFVPMPLVKAISSRYVAGVTLGEAAGRVGLLNGQGYKATIDILGEDAKDAAHADGTVLGYQNVLARIMADGLDSNISVKLSHLGIRLNQSDAEARLSRILDTAAGLGSFVRIDMEDSGLTGTTLDLYRALRTKYPHVGTVLQAALHRTADDARALAAEGANLRLCKGIYREPRAIAFQSKADIRQSYLETAEVLLSAERTYTAFATHDRVLLQRLLELTQRMEVPRDRFEFQALLGVPVDDVLSGLVFNGYTVRWYVPFGEEWYAYSTRRLKENPKMASYIVRHWFGR
jgi:proline dehydrogenase